MIKNALLLLATNPGSWFETQTDEKCGTIAKSVVDNIHAEIKANFDQFGRHCADKMNIISVGILVNELVKRGLCAPEQKAAMEVLSKVCLQEAGRNFVDYAFALLTPAAVRKLIALKKDWETEKVTPVGELVGVTDPNVIMNTVAAFYAQRAASKSRLHDMVYNVQSAGTKDVEVDLTNLAPQEGQFTLTPAGSKNKYPVDTIRDNLTFEMETNDGVKTIEFDPSIRPYRGRKIHTTPAINKKQWTAKQKEIHNSITLALDKEISPLLMHEKDKEPLPYKSVYEHGCHKDNHKYNFQASPASSTEVPTVPTEAQVKLSKMATTRKSYPVTLSQCKNSKGQYICPVCNTQVLNKSKLNPYTPAALPKDMPSDTEGLHESQQWAMSVMCGACIKRFKEGREKITGAWVVAQRTKENTTAPVTDTATTDATKDKVLAELQEEHANFTQYFEAAVELAARREEELKGAESLSQTFLQIKNEVPARHQEVVATCKYNVQQAHAAMQQMEAKADEVLRKIEAIRKGQASPIPVNNVQTSPATPAKAKVISIPTTASSVQPMKLSRKEKKQQRQLMKRGK